MTNREDAVLASNLGADALGFIFYPKSPRYIEPAMALEIMRSLPPFITKVGVVVNMPMDELHRLTESLPLNLLQLHGDEDPGYCKWLSLHYLKVFRVGPDFDVSALDDYDASGFLLDTFHADHYGGTGETFDWQIAKTAARKARIVLSGGLTSRNVSEALNTVRPYAVDVCSGVEAKPGKKDSERMRQFFEKVREFETDAEI
ncbi:phosphoribosylanthranilate isomerase [bacterium]|nr:phosphoribosylanthranilate isomerase [bacterium]